MERKQGTHAPKCPFSIQFGKVNIQQRRSALLRKYDYETRGDYATGLCDGRCSIAEGREVVCVGVFDKRKTDSDALLVSKRRKLCCANVDRSIWDILYERHVPSRNSELRRNFFGLSVVCNNCFCTTRWDTFDDDVYGNSTRRR